ncbi:MAG: CDP-diacylglycerol--glycerol-3-phosphate 3-phosphatidyltransferase [Bacilli bacterium]|nr:CDP-diacylglycerol--glycerol-3-phosphate 3-phosphatidyltransferase [Bacilli bacterium]
MNLPNKLTLLRIFIVPIIVIIPFFRVLNETILFTIDNSFSITYFSLANLLVLIFFIIASVTDYFDGHLARKNNQVTDFGKLMDPLADKILVVATLIVLLEWGRMYGWAIILIVAREFLVTGIRQLGVANGRVIAASYFGKAKTVTQMITIIYLLVFAPNFASATGIIGFVLIILATLLTIASGLDYLIKNRNLIQSM